MGDRLGIRGAVDILLLEPLQNWKYLSQDTSTKYYNSFPSSKSLPPVRLELTAFRLWDWRAAYCATEAWCCSPGPGESQYGSTHPHDVEKIFCQKWDLNPRPHTRTRILLSTPYQGSKAEPWVWRLRPLGHPDSWHSDGKKDHPIWGSNPGPLD